MRIAVSGASGNVGTSVLRALIEDGSVDSIVGIARRRPELGWRPTRSATDAIRDLLEGMADHAGENTAPLAPGADGPLRIREFLSGVGARN